MFRLARKASAALRARTIVTQQAHCLCTTSPGNKRNHLVSDDFFVSYRSVICGVVAFYNLTVGRRESFNHLTRWLEEARANGNPNMTIMLIGNKCDLEHRCASIFRFGIDQFEPHGFQNGLFDFGFEQTSCKHQGRRAIRRRKRTDIHGDLSKDSSQRRDGENETFAKIFSGTTGGGNR